MILIAIGANLPSRGASPLARCRMAADEIAALRLRPAGRAAARVAPWFDTEPVPRGSGPRYVNGMIALDAGADEAAIDPAALLRALLAIEARAGRARPAGVADAPRGLDLDIVAIGGLVRRAPDPVLPHPRAHARRFVLEPLARLCPGWRHPALGLTVEALLDRLPDQGVRPLDAAALEAAGRRG